VDAVGAERAGGVDAAADARAAVRAEALTSMLDLFLAAMADTRDDLALRVGGRVA
jgi:hypothetical protein